MKVKYIAETYGDLINGNIYDCLGIELDCYRIIDESKEDYLYPIIEFEIIEEKGQSDDCSVSYS